MVGIKADEKGVELVFDVAPQLPSRLVGAPTRLGQVLINLCNNAVKFTERGEIVVAVEVQERDATSALLRFEVRDTGIGMNADQQRQLFQAFSQADASTSRRYGGTGLGLAICRRLVGLMGGQIDVESEPGKGSCFHFSARLGVPAESMQPGANEGLRETRILVVDDNASACQVLVGMARSFGMRGDSACDGAQALQLLAREDAQGDPYDLVLVDWKMPRMDGPACVREIERATFRHGAPAVIMVTGFGGEDLKQRLVDAGMSAAALLTKPVMPSSLLDACLTALGRVAPGKGRMTLRDEALEAQQAHLRGARILLVEDNAINQEIARDLLGRSGIVVTVVEDGQQAIDILARQSFDGVLMDCQMPVLDGYAATAILRRQERLRDLPIIAMTANAMVGDRDKALAAGATFHALHIERHAAQERVIRDLARAEHPLATIVEQRILKISRWPCAPAASGRGVVLAGQVSLADAYRPLFLNRFGRLALRGRERGFRGDVRRFCFRSRCVVLLDDPGVGPEDRDELCVDARVARHHFSLEEVVRLACEVADEPPSFGDEQRAGRHIPGAQARFKEAVVIAGGHIAQVEGGRARPAQAGAVLHHGLEHLKVALEVVALAEREARADQRILQASSLGHAKALVVEEGTAPFGCVEQVVARRVVDHGLLYLAPEREGDGDRVHRQAVDEVRGPIQRVDDPEVVAVLGAVRAARLLGQDAVAGVGGEQDLDDGLLGGLIDFSHEIVGRLGADPEQLEIQRCPVDDRPCCTCRLDGDVEHGMERLRHEAASGNRGGGGEMDGPRHRAGQGAAWHTLRIMSRDFSRRPMPVSDPTRFILLNTSHPGNVGAAARAMRVMGFSELVLVAPRHAGVLTHPEAVAMASGATDVLDRARVVTCLAEALDGVTYACATAMTPRDFGPPVFAPRELFATLAAEPHSVAFVFGSERFGMSNDDVYRCHACLSIPTDPAYGSLNLAQAVQLIAYDWRQAQGGFPVVARTPTAGLADGAAVQGLLAHWQTALQEIGFLDPAVPKKLMPRLNQLLNRTQLTREEVHILRGIARAMQRPR